MFINARTQRSAAALIYVLHSGNLYGSERMALATLGGMVEYDERVVFAPPATSEGSVAEAARHAKIDAVIFKSKWQLLCGLLHWFRRFRRLDVIGTGVSQTVACHVLAKLMGVRLRQLHVVHGGASDVHAYSRRSRLNRFPVLIIAVSEFVREKLITYGARADAVRVIENFIPDSDIRASMVRPSYHSDDERARPIDSKRVKIAVVSRVDPIKRVDLLVDAASAGLLDEFCIDVYGTGDDLRKLAERCAGVHNICFHGFVSDIGERLAEADLFLHLCPEEPFGLVILEAFASNIVAVVPDAGGAGAIIQDGVNGLRYHAGSVADLCRVLQHARALPEAELERMRRTARDQLTTRFSSVHGLRRYREALAEAPLSNR